MSATRKLMMVVFALSLVVAACGDDDAAETTTTQADPGVEETTTAPPEIDETEPPEDDNGDVDVDDGDVAFDIGVDPASMTINLGLLADLTGPFSPLVIDIVDAQQVYWDRVNDAGGIGGEWTVDLLIEDTSYDVANHVEKYEALREQVLAFTQSTGSPQTVATLERIYEDNVLVFPLSWYSGWADPELTRGLILAQGTNYCLEAMNLMTFMNDMGGETVALVTVPGDYGQDAAAGVKHAAAELGMEIVYDGEGAVIPGQDQTPVVTEIVGSGADWVFITSDSTSFAEILGGAVGAGFEGLWTGSVPGYTFQLLDSPVGPILDQVYFQSLYNATWDMEVPGMDEMRTALTEAYPDRRPSDAFLIGWNEAKAMEQILELAVANGDLSRAGVVEAAQSIEVIDLEGTAPNQTYAGTPNDYVVRETGVGKPDLELYQSAGGENQTLAEGGTTGTVLVQDFFVSEVAADYDFTGACFEI